MLHRIQWILALTGWLAVAADRPAYEYVVLATQRTSTMEREMNAAAEAGFVFASVMGGETAVGGNETVVVMRRENPSPNAAKRKYKLLATSRTSTMQKELQQAGDEGFQYCGQTVFESAFGGREVVVILERDLGKPAARYDYRLLATKKTSTMQKELGEAGRAGYQLLGMTVSKTAFGGEELVCLLSREAQ